MVKRLVVLTSVVLIACQGSGDGSASVPSGQATVSSPSPTTPSPSPTTRTETIELDFSEPGTVGQVLFRIPYGEGKDKVGYLPPCLRRSCEWPCPCSTRIQPLSFAPTLDGGVWVLDPVKERVVRFSAHGDFVEELAVPGNDFRNFDVVLVDERLIVVGQRGDFDAKLISLESGQADSRLLRFEGDPTPAFFLTSSQDRLFTTASPDLLDPDNMDPEEIPVEIARDGTAVEVPGVPFLDGWKIFHDFVGSTTIPLEVSSTLFNWSMELDAVLLREIKGEKQEVPGGLSWEFAVSEQGDIHLLITAYTEKGGSINGFWLITVTPEGFVGEPVKLRGPTGRDDQQQRRLALGADDRPLAMWAGKKALNFEALPSSKALP